MVVDELVKSIAQAKVKLEMRARGLEDADVGYEDAATVASLDRAPDALVAELLLDKVHGGVAGEFGQGDGVDADRLERAVLERVACALAGDADLDHIRGEDVPNLSPDCV